MNYIDQPSFEDLDNPIRKTEQALNGFMSYVRRQRAGSKEFGDKVIYEGHFEYELDNQENH